MAYRSFQFLEFEVRGVRKVTTGEHFFAGAYGIIIFYTFEDGKKLYI